MRKDIWYNVAMPKGFEKKGEPLTLKVQPSLLSALKAISETEDRPLGYVARELMVRGLALYRLDGKLRDVSPLILKGEVLKPSAPETAIPLHKTTTERKRRSR